MNKARRKELAKVIRVLNTVQDQEELYSVISDLENIKDDEQYSYDNIPENLQYSTRAEESEMAIGHMESALDLLNELYGMDEFDKNSELIQEAIDSIENARW